ncbi:MAG TPA: lamin tail domain-containing protein [Euzebyales bacterium]|nr:lamin tail domain-containing protein [Euzebyales bacterium]
MSANLIRHLTTLLTFVIMLVAIAGPASAAIRIERIRYDAPGPDRRTNAHLNEERVVLINTGDSARNIGGWIIRDLAGWTYRVPDGFRLGPDRMVRVHTGKGSDDSNDLFWGRGSYVWNNDADRATLRNRDRDIVDRCRYDDGSKSENRTTKHC